MRIKNSPIWNEIKDIFSNNDVEGYVYSCQLHCGEEIINPLTLNSIDITRDYIEQLSDYIFIEIDVSMGVYALDIYPNRDTLEVTLIKDVSSPVTGGTYLNKPRMVRKYRGTIIDPVNPLVEGENLVNDRASLDLTGQTSIIIQLVELAAEQIVMTTVGDIFHEVTATDFLKGMLTISASQLELDIDSSITAIDVVEADNKDIRENMIVPQGTYLHKLPRYIQEHQGGVYTTDIANYIQQGIWYVFPKWNTARFDKVTRNAMVINLPSTAMPAVERSYLYKDEKLILISTAKSKQIDTSERELLSEGSGIRYARGFPFMDAFVAVEAKDAYVSRDDNIVEYVVENRKVGLNNVPMSKRRITSNHQHEMSQLAKRLGQLIVVPWENSNPDLIYPGMPCKYVYEEKGIIKESYGVIVSATSKVVRTTNVAASVDIYSTNTILTLFIKKEG